MARKTKKEIEVKVLYDPKEKITDYTKELIDLRIGKTQKFASHKSTFFTNYPLLYQLFFLALLKTILQKQVNKVFS